MKLLENTPVKYESNLRTKVSVNMFLFICLTPIQWPSVMPSNKRFNKICMGTPVIFL